MSSSEQRVAKVASLLAPLPTWVWAQAGPSAQEQLEAAWAQRRLDFVVAAVLVVLACQLLFKIYARWPSFERWLVLGTVAVLPPLAVGSRGAKDSSVFFHGAGAVIDSLLLWGVVAGVAFGVWWFLKQRTTWLSAPPAPLEDALARTRRPAESATGADSAPAAAGSPTPAPAKRAQLSSPEPKPAVSAAPPAPKTLDSLFISYRRQDSADVTGRIYDRLVQQFGRERIFKDVDSIPLGVDFREHLGNVIGRCDLVVAVIGPQWLQVQGPGGRRLDDSGDFVRIEIESALARNIPVVPVLVGGAAMPSAEDLPASLASLSFRNGLAVRPDPDFHRDMDRLIAGLGALNRI